MQLVSELKRKTKKRNKKAKKKENDKKNEINVELIISGLFSLCAECFGCMTRRPCRKGPETMEKRPLKQIKASEYGAVNRRFSQWKLMVVRAADTLR